MKKIIFCLAACAVVVGLTGCGITNDCSCKKAPYIPADLPDVRCDTYNDVRTIFYSYIQFCDNYPAHNPKCGIIRVVGWVDCQYNDYMYLDCSAYQQNQNSISLWSSIKIEYPKDSMKYESGYYLIVGIPASNKGGCDNDLYIHPITITKIED